MIKYVLLSFSLFLLLVEANGQHAGLPLQKVLEQLEQQNNITISYDVEIARRLVVSGLSDTLNLQTQFDFLSAQTGLIFSEAGPGIFLMKAVSRPFCVRVLDESGNPIELAQIIINNKSTNITTDIDGYARFESKLSFQDTLNLHFYGYDDKRMVVKELIDENCLSVNMSFGKMALRELVITNYITSGIDFSKEDLSLQIRTKDLALLPGETDGDILLAIKTLPGITSPNGKAGNLHIRGSATDQTLVLFDNIPIYHKGHYFGTISPYNPVAVDEVTVYRSGYGPELGGRVGGAIKLESKKNIPDSARFGVGLNTYYASAFADVPVSKKLGISGSVRSTYNGEWRSPKLKALNELALQNSIVNRAEENPEQEVLKNSFTFHDVNLSVNRKIKDGLLSMSFLTIGNVLNMRVDNQTNNSVMEAKNELNNTGINLEWGQYWNQKFNTIISSAYSDYKVGILTKHIPADRAAFIPNQFDQHIRDLNISAKAYVTLNDHRNSKLNLGYELKRQAIDGFVYSNAPRRPETSIHQESEAYLHSLFINHQTTLFTKLTINSGIRSNYYSPLDDFRIEPRVFLNWQQKSNLSFKSSYGLYSQYITQNVYFDFEDTKIENLVWELASDEKPIIKSAQWMLGSTWKPGSFVVDLEFYHKEITDLSTLKTGKTPTDSDRSTVGNLNVYGADILLKKKWNRLDTWISYSYTYTEMDFPEINLITFETYYDQPHTFNINATLPYKSWSFSLGWQYQSGVPVYTHNTFFPTPGMAPESQSDEPVTSQKSEGRFPAQHQLDMSAVYHFAKKPRTWNGSIGLSLLNIYDRENFVAENYITKGPTTSLEQRYSIGFAPNIMLNIRW